MSSIFFLFYVISFIIFCIFVVKVIKSVSNDKSPLEDIFASNKKDQKTNNSSNTDKRDIQFSFVYRCVGSKFSFNSDIQNLLEIIQKKDIPLSSIEIFIIIPQDGQNYKSAIGSLMFKIPNLRYFESNDPTNYKSFFVGAIKARGKFIIDYWAVKDELSAILPIQTKIQHYISFAYPEMDNSHKIIDAKNQDKMISDDEIENLPSSIKLMSKLTSISKPTVFLILQRLHNFGIGMSGELILLSQHNNIIPHFWSTNQMKSRNNIFSVFFYELVNAITLYMYQNQYWTFNQ